MAITIRQLEYLRAVAQSDSIIGASRTLHVSQPSLSVAIRDLERQLGTQLFERGARGVVPTEAGQYLAGAAQRILHDTEAAERHVRALGRGHIGHVALAVTPTYSWYYLPQLLEELSARAPGLRVSLMDPTPLEILGLVNAGQADLGIVVVDDVAALRQVYGVEFHIQVIRAIDVVAALPRRLASLPDPVQLAQLESEPWVLPVSALSFPGIASLIRKQWDLVGIHPDVVQNVSTTQTGLPLVAAGIGVMLAPESILSVTELAVEVRRLTPSIPPLTAVVLWRREAFMGPAARRVLESIVRSA